MGTKFAGVSVSGYNANPPPDDGSQTAANQVFWSTIKSKLGDPLDTFAAAISAALTTALDFSVTQKSANYTTVAGDHMRTVEIAPTVSSAVTISLGDAATMTVGYTVRIKNSSAVVCTVGRITSGDTIDGAAADLSLNPGEAITATVNTAADGYLIISRGPFLGGTVTGDTIINADFQVDGGSFIFNESGGNQDARFEGENDVNLLFTDASADAVGIGTSTPAGGSAKLDIFSASATVGVRTNYNGTVIGRLASSSTGVVNIGAGTAHDVVVLRNDSEVARFKASGLFLSSYTAGALPSAATAAGLIYVSDEAGGAVLAFSDGTNWRRVTDRAVVS